MIDVPFADFINFESDQLVQPQLVTPGQPLHQERSDDEDYVPADYQPYKQPLLPQRLLTTAEYMKHIDGIKEKAAQWGNE